jgi:hypothetical protein
MWNDPNFKYMDYLDPIEMGLQSLRKKEFDREYYVDIATGQVKKRLYVKSNQHKQIEVSENE